MHINNVELKSAAYSSADFPKDNRPEIAFLGRSNVGKSSLINRLLNRKNTARTSSTPGKTRGLYFYLLNELFYFVDLPGYGYARVSKEIQREWGPLIESYLGDRPMLHGCIHLVDCRHDPSSDDKLMARWLRFHKIPTITVVTKADKLSRSALTRQTGVIRKQLELNDSELLLTFSARTGAGRDHLWRAVNNLLDLSRGRTF